MVPYDARAIANLLLDLAEHDQKPLTNLVLQKLTYFAHGMYLVKTGQPLLRGEFEAWQFGPVHPHVYAAFKTFGEKHIDGRAERTDPVTLKRSPIPKVDDESVHEFVEDVYRNLKHRLPSALVDISHAKDGPWEFVVHKAQSTSHLGLRITNDLILERFKYHKVSVSGSDREVPNENSPFT